MDFEIWIKILTNVSNFETASPKPYKLLKFLINFVTTVKSRHAPTRELKQTTTATATGTLLNKRFNEQNNSCARAL